MIPDNHILRLINRYVDFSFIHKKVNRLYSDIGRPSIDPELMIRMLLIGYLYGITSERRLCDEVKMHIGYRWFVGLNMNDEVPDHSTFSKNRHGRFKESGIFQDIFDEIIRQCTSHGLITGEHLTVDSTLVKANASFKSMEPIVVNMRPKEFIDKIEKGNPVKDDPWEPNDDYKYRGTKISNKTHRSKTDPDARLAKKAPGDKTKLSHSASYLMDNKSHIIVGVKGGKPDRNSDAKAALEMLKELKWKFKIKPITLGADKAYATGEFVRLTIKEGITPHIPIMDTRSQHDKGIYSIEEFTFDNHKNEYICPQGERLKYWGVHRHSRQFVYRAKVKDCRICKVKDKCTRDRSRSLSYHIDEPYIKYARGQTKTYAYRISQRMRKRIEQLFGEAKEYMRLRVAKFRRLWNVKEQFLLTATAQNIKRMVKLLHRGISRPRRVTKRLTTPIDLFIRWPIRGFEFFKMLSKLLFHPYANAYAPIG